MTFLNDVQITARCHGLVRPLITPFNSKMITSINGTKIWSYGVACFGYEPKTSLDVYSIRQATLPKTLDPSNPDHWVKEKMRINTDPETGRTYVVAKPNTRILLSTVERFDMPRNIGAIFVSKSTLSRAGFIIATSSLEPEWRGNLTIPVNPFIQSDTRLYVGEGAIQIFFFEGLAPKISYADRENKYQDAQGAVEAK